MPITIRITPIASTSRPATAFDSPDEDCPACDQKQTCSESHTNLLVLPPFTRVRPVTNYGIGAGLVE